MNWIDAAVGLFLAFSAWNGFRRGLINELSGFLALAAAAIAAFTYGGQFDGAIGTAMHLGPGSSHVAGLLAYASIAYIVVWSAGLLLDRVAKLPLLNLINGVLGSALAITKTLFIVAILDYVATLAPLPGDLRGDLSRSAVDRAFAGANAGVNDDLGSHLPPYLQPFWSAATHHGDAAPPDASATSGP